MAKLRVSSGSADQCGYSYGLLLKFDPQTFARHEAEYGTARALQFRNMILLGLIFYNAYNFTSIVLLPDVLWLSIQLRVVAVTIGSLGLAYMVTKVSPLVREWIVTAGMVNAAAVPLFLAWYSTAPYSAYTLAELPLTLFFGGMVLGLWFRHLLVLLAAVSLMVAVVLLTKSGLPTGLAVALGVQAATAICFIATASYLRERRVNDEYIKTLQARDVAALAMDENEHLAELSLSDSLTSLPNRRHFDGVLAERVTQAQGGSLFLVDVDYFKQFNDTYGHVAGDECLQSVATALSIVCDGNSAFVARIGGEEFAVIAAAASELDVTRLATALLAQVREAAEPHNGRPDRQNIVTVSVGAVSFQAQGANEASYLMAAADDALYRAKSQGRNRFVRFEDLDHRPGEYHEAGGKVG